METKTVNGIDYNFETNFTAGNVTISWVDRELNHEIWLFRFTQDSKISRAICTYSIERSNKGLLIAKGKSNAQAENIKEVVAVSKKPKEVFFVPQGPTIELTENKVKRFMNMITERELGFSSYAYNSTTEDWELIP